MTNAYKVVGRRAVQTLEPGEEGELELSPEEEQGHLAAGRLEIIPRAYRVCGPRKVHNTEPNGTFEAALSVGNEASLIEAGHIERVKEPAKKKADTQTNKEKEG